MCVPGHATHMSRETSRAPQEMCQFVAARARSFDKDECRADANRDTYRAFPLYGDSSFLRAWRSG